MIFLSAGKELNRMDKNGLKQGDWKEFYPNGGIKSEKTYKDDLMHGYYKEYDTHGKLVLTMLYENGAIVKSNVEDEPDIEMVTKHDQEGKIIYSGSHTAIKFLLGFIENSGRTERLQIHSYIMITDCFFRKE